MSTTSIETTAASFARHGDRSAMPQALAIGMLVALVVMAPQAWSVWSRDTFLDPDDALQTVQIRDFLAGQPWFDMVPHRLAPGHPFSMHWSRLLDAPLAVLQQLFALMLPPTLAERAMRVTAPVLFFAAALAATLHLARRTVGEQALLPAALLLGLSSEVLTNFMPGHIHHHGLQAALLLLAVAALIRSLARNATVRSAAFSGGVAMLSLGIGLQNLPFVVGLVAASLLLWVWDGASRSRQLVAFGFGLLTAVPVFLLDVAPAHYGDGSCDAFSAAHLVAALGTMALCVVLAALTARLATRTRRLAIAMVGAAGVLGFVTSIFPQCLRDPMAGVDPILRDAWLSGVGEALPLFRLVVLSPQEGIALALTLLIGLCATGAAFVLSAPDLRPRWAVLVALSSIGVVGTLWQVRVAASTCTLLVPGAAWLVLRVYERLKRHPHAPALLLAVLTGSLANGSGWSALALMASRLPGPTSASAAASPSACFDPANLRTLAALPPGLVLSTIDPGSTMLAYTAHSVVAAPYHRNTYGNRLSILALSAPPEAARTMIEEAGIRYLALCRDSNETAETIARHPESLSAAVMAGKAPEWLAPIEAPGQDFVLFEVR